MDYDFTTAANNYEDAMIADLKALVAIDSERDTDKATTEAPLGPGPAAAIKHALAMAQRDGFTTKNVENVAGRIELGSGDDILGVLGHVDVVPAGEGWETDPFTPVIKDGKMYGRGTADDKGPTIAAYYALKILRDLNVPLNKRVHMILGSDEESEWYGMDRYMATEENPTFGFSPDAEFPIINGEKGIASFLISQKRVAPKQAATTMTSFDAGIRPNMVPVSATAKLTGTIPADLADQLQTFAMTNDVTADLTANGSETVITLVGQGAHASTPAIGTNAGTYLAAFLNASSLDLDPAATAYLATITKYLHRDTTGTLLGINYADRKMGELTASPDIFKFSQDGKQTVLINVRYPQGTSADAIRDQIETAIGVDLVDVTIDGHAQEPHYVPESDPLVQTLLDVYTEHTGLPGHEMIIGGGTYGRILDRGVAFGAQMPGAPDIMHLPNEYIKIEDVVRAAAIYADAIYRLAK
ncbi:dipeptidase PepV [Lacticaseibacillus hulanensis]|uniref:dipeptidase PepV n=1 Tax=Lacticaseibacillus hulanensis TaxID=2493111 RepID=UPI000FDB7503|nr:dipeptidase PepV [Lacticaseibacillus hulanensis]